MTKIGIIGATGTAGSAIFKEAVKRKLEPVALVRDAPKAKRLLGEDVNYLEKDAFDLTVADLQDFDVIVDAFASEPNKAYLHVDLAAKLVHLFRGKKQPRLFFILGAGSLKTGTDRHLLVRDLEAVPESAAWIKVPQNQLKELDFLRGVDDVDWVGVSPASTFQAGTAQKSLLGKDDLLINDQGNSVTSSGTLAAAILDEIERPKFNQERFTVADASVEK